MVKDFPAWAGSSQFQSDVDSVIDEIVAASGSENVANEEAFTAEVVKRLRARGFCATNKKESPGGGSDDEVGVRLSRDRSEQFDIVFSNGRVRRQGYVAVCKPSRF